MPAAEQNDLCGSGFLAIRSARHFEVGLVFALHYLQWDVLLFERRFHIGFKAIHGRDEDFRSCRKRASLLGHTAGHNAYDCEQRDYECDLAKHRLTPVMRISKATQSCRPSIFSLMCLAQASPALCRPRTEFPLCTE